MNWFYNLIGRIFFRRQQDWERFRNAKIMTWVVIFSVVLALVIAKVLKYMYSHAK